MSRKSFGAHKSRQHISCYFRAQLFAAAHFYTAQQAAALWLVFVTAKLTEMSNRCR